LDAITSVRRRRRWAISEKERIVAAALESGAVASQVGRAAGSLIAEDWAEGFLQHLDLCLAHRSISLGLWLAIRPASPVIIITRIGNGGWPGVSRIYSSKKRQSTACGGFTNACSCR
jgi:hypothetical protein